jgi:hypothetical protein
MGNRTCVVVTGPLAQYATGFEASLAAQGYRSGRELLSLMAEVSQWLGERELGAVDLTVSQVELFLASRQGRRRAGTLSMRGMSPLLDYLVIQSVAQQLAPSPRTPRNGHQRPTHS